MISGNCRYTGVAKTYRGTNCFFTESQYTEKPVISPTPIKDRTGIQNYQVELPFSSCVCVYNQKNVFHSFYITEYNM